MKNNYTFLKVAFSPKLNIFSCHLKSTTLNIDWFLQIFIYSASMYSCRCRLIHVHIPDSIKQYIKVFENIVKKPCPLCSFRSYKFYALIPISSFKFYRRKYILSFNFFDLQLYTFTMPRLNCLCEDM